MPYEYFVPSPASAFSSLFTAREVTARTEAIEALQAGIVPFEYLHAAYHKMAIPRIEQSLSTDRLTLYVYENMGVRGSEVKELKKQIKFSENELKSFKSTYEQIPNHLKEPRIYSFCEPEKGSVRKAILGLTAIITLIGAGHATHLYSYALDMIGGLAIGALIRPKTWGE